jgi:hypothetical protein
MLPVSLDCPLLIAPSDFANDYLLCADTKGEIRISKLKKDMQYIGRKKKDKNDLQGIHIKLKIEQHEPTLKAIPHDTYIV